MTTGKTNPENFERRILLAVAGGSPAIVTETLYALTQTTQPAYIPTELHIITTAGVHAPLLKALCGETGKVQQLCADYNIPPPAFSPDNIYQITDAGGLPLRDIITAGDNELAADFITIKMRELSSDDNASLHVSIAGGRKTMSYYAGYALSLYGRMQDRLSHVLVDESLIQRDFFYPRPDEEIAVSLADVPFVRLREGLGFAEDLTQGKHSFNQAVELVQRQFAPAKIHMNRTSWLCGDTPVQDPKPTRFSVYAWLLERHRQGDPALRFYPDEAETDYATELLGMYRRIFGEKGISKMEEALKRGMTVEYLRPHISHCNKVLQNSLKKAARHYQIQTSEKTGFVEYSLPPELPTDSITLEF